MFQTGVRSHARGSEASSPGKAALDDQASGQRDKALPDFRQLDDLKLNAMLSRVLRGLIACAALIDEVDLNRLAGDLLDALRQLLHLIVVLIIGG